MLKEKLLARFCRYRIISENCVSCDLVQYTAYGIQAISTNKEDEQVYSTVSDISTDQRQVAEMVRKFNKFRLSPVHLLDAVEDMLP